MLRPVRSLLLALAACALVLPASALAVGPDTPPAAASGFTLITGWNGAIGDVLTCEHGTVWTGGNITVTHDWKRDGVTFATGGTYTVTVSDAMHSLSCSEIATNSAGSASTDSQMFGVSDVPAVVVTAPHITGAATVGQTVSCDGASFSGSNLTAQTFRWSREGQGVGSAQTYTFVAADADRQVRCHVGVSNGSSNVEADSADVTVDSGLPTRVKVPSISGSGHPGLALTCSPGTWSGDGIAYSYQWLRNEKPIAGASKPSLVLTDADVDKLFVCRVTARNAQGAASLNSNGIVGFAPGITAKLTKVQPAVPKLRAALTSGFQARLTCNVSCATESHVFILLPLARKLGLATRQNTLGGEVFVGTGVAHRTYGGDLVVTTKFTARAAKALATQKTVHVNVLYETSYGTVYNFRKYHQATSNSITLRR